MAILRCLCSSLHIIQLYIYAIGQSIYSGHNNDAEEKKRHNDKYVVYL